MCAVFGYWIGGCSGALGLGELEQVKLAGTGFRERDAVGPKSCIVCGAVQCFGASVIVVAGSDVEFGEGDWQRAGGHVSSDRSTQILQILDVTTGSGCFVLIHAVFLIVVYVKGLPVWVDCSIDSQVPLLNCGLPPFRILGCSIGRIGRKDVGGEAFAEASIDIGDSRLDGI